MKLKACLICGSSRDRDDRSVVVGETKCKWIDCANSRHKGSEIALKAPWREPFGKALTLLGASK